MTINWKNIPIPEGHLITIVLGVFAESNLPQPFIQAEWIGYALGIPISLAGIIIAAWSVREVNAIVVDDPEKLITTGPYAISRNPMYIAWNLIYLGAIFLVNTRWLLLLFTFVLGYTHYLVILREEKGLQERFGSEYREYCKRVRRYF
jgi:protein-S-isoprenylcysteine O-methyltransferase Ste14